MANVTEDTSTTIGDLEALLIRAIGPKSNRAYMKFKGAEEWKQIEYDNVDMYLGRLDTRVAGGAAETSGGVSRVRVQADDAAT